MGHEDKNGVRKTGEIMEKRQLKPSIFLPRELWEKLYDKELSVTDFLVLMVLYHLAKPVNGIARVSYNGFADLIGKAPNTIKSAIKRLEDNGDIVLEPTSQGRKAFRIGILNYYCSNKTYTTRDLFNEIFTQKGQPFCKVDENIAKSKMVEPAKLANNTDYIEKPAISPKEYINKAKQILAKSAKPIDIDNNLNKEKEEKQNSRNIAGISHIRGCLSSSFSSLLSSSKRSSVLKGYDLASHPDWGTLISRYGEEKVTTFIETAGDACMARSFEQAFAFVRNGLKKRDEKGWI